MQPDAVQDILIDDRYAGMMSTIDGLTGIVDSMFMTVITFVAFFIISVALLRNVLAGAYCAFPKFWDQVARAHEENENKAFFEEIKGIKDSYKTASMGSIKTFVLRIVPNIKSLTDFEDNTLSPKSYFIKAIPQMIGVVIIGVFIYNGYYRDFTAIVANTGAELVQRVVLDTDPMEIIDTFLNTAGRPHFATDDSINDYGKNKNRIAVGIYQAIISKYSDIQDANAKANLAADIDAVVDEMFPNDSPAEDWFGNSTNYKVTINCDLVKPGAADSLWDGIGNDLKQTEDVFKCGWYVGIGKEDSGFATSSSGGTLSQTIRFDSVKDAVKEEWCVRVAISAKRNAIVTTNTGAVECSMTVLNTKPNPSNGYNSGFKNVGLTSDGKTWEFQKEDGTSVTIAAMDCDTDTLTQNWAFYVDENSYSDKGALTGSMSLKVTDAKGKTITLNVTSITVGNALSITSDSEDYTVTGSAGGTISVTKKEATDDGGDDPTKNNDPDGGAGGGT